MERRVFRGIDWAWGMVRLSIAVAMCLGVLGVAQLSAADDFDRIAVETVNGRQIFTVEIVATPQTRAKGLQGRRQLAPDAGMLFDFERNQPVAMWMEDTWISLDMLFIDAGGRIVNIAERTTPFSRKVIPSQGAVRAVLEINGGLSAKLGIRPGDRVIHPLFAAD